MSILSTQYHPRLGAEVTATAAAMLLGTAGVLWVYADSNRLVLAAGALTILIAGWVMSRRLRIYGALDPLAMFCAAFAAYNGLILIRVGMQSNPNDIVLPYPVSYSVQTYIQTGLFSVIAITTVAISTMCLGGFIRSIKPSGKSRPLSARQSSSLFAAGLITYGIGCVFFVLQLFQNGGFVATFAVARMSRYQPDGVSGFSFPYAAFVCAGIALLTYSSFGGLASRKRIYCALLFGIWCFLQLMLGDRRPLLGALITFLSVITICRTGVLKVTLKLVLILVCSYALFSVFGKIRWLLPMMMLNRASVSDVVDVARDEGTFDWLLPENTEFAGPYFSLLESADSNGEPAWGQSYYESISALFPRFLYGGDKPPSHAREFADRIKASYLPRAKFAAGYGFDPIAEANDNFSSVGIVAVFFLWACAFLWLSKLPAKGHFGVLCFALLLPQAINANRIDFRIVFVESTYQFVALCLGYSVVMLIEGSDITHTRRVPFTSISGALPRVQYLSRSS